MADGYVNVAHGVSRDGHEARREECSPGEKGPLGLFSKSPSRPPEAFQCLLKGIDIPESLIHGREADVGDVIEVFQDTHDCLTDRTARDLFFPASLDLPLDRGDDFPNAALGDRSLLECLSNPTFEFLAPVGFSPSVLLHDVEAREFHLLIG